MILETTSKVFSSEGAVKEFFNTAGWKARKTGRELNFSKNYITSDFYDLNRLKINKLIREFLRNDNETLEIEFKEKQFQENYIEQTKKGLMKKLWG